MTKLDILYNILKGLHSNESYDGLLSYTSFINEYRTFGATVPRGVGKTTFLYKKHLQESSLLFVQNYNVMNNFLGEISGVIPFSAISRVLQNMRGRSTCGMKYSCFFIDEPQNMSIENKLQLANLVYNLWCNGLLHKDFYIYTLGT